MLIGSWHQTRAGQSLLGSLWLWVERQGQDDMTVVPGTSSILFVVCEVRPCKRFPHSPASSLTPSAALC